MAAAAALRTVRLEIAKDGIAVIRMIKGENKFNQPLVNDMGEALDEVERNKDVRCLIFTGQGKFFSYGLDLPRMAKQTKDVNKKFWYQNESLLERITLFPMPTIAVMNGHTFGMGAIYATACDYRVMTKGQGRFWFPETKLRMPFPPGFLETIRVKLHGSKILRDAALFSKRYTAEEALQAGIVDEAVEESDVMAMATALRYCNEMAGEKLDRNTVSATKNELYGVSIRAKREAHIQSMTVEEEHLWFERFAKLAKSIASKM